MADTGHSYSFVLPIINTATNPDRLQKRLHLWDSSSGYVASEGGAPFVARRAMNLHGCLPASLCPPFFLLRGYPGSAKLVLGRPPSCGDSAGPSRCMVCPSPTNHKLLPRGFFS
jgi:hypothetical protein